MHSDVMNYTAEGWTLSVNANLVRVKIILEVPEKSTQRFQEAVKNKFSFSVDDAGCYVTLLPALRPDLIKNLLDRLSVSRLITAEFATKIARSFPDGSDFVDLTDPCVIERGKLIGCKVEQSSLVKSPAEILARQGLMPRPVENKEDVISNNRAFEI